MENFPSFCLVTLSAPLHNSNFPLFEKKIMTPFYVQKILPYPYPPAWKKNLTPLLRAQRDPPSPKIGLPNPLALGSCPHMAELRACII